VEGYCIDRALVDLGGDNPSQQQLGVPAQRKALKVVSLQQLDVRPLGLLQTGIFRIAFSQAPEL